VAASNSLCFHSGRSAPGHESPFIFPALVAITGACPDFSDGFVDQPRRVSGVAAVILELIGDFNFTFASSRRRNVASICGCSAAMTVAMKHGTPDSRRGA
jgi:hypothetical protein